MSEYKDNDIYYLKGSQLTDLKLHYATTNKESGLGLVKRIEKQYVGALPEPYKDYELAIVDCLKRTPTLWDKRRTRIE
jgi:hypothetical protein